VLTLAGRHLAAPVGQLGTLPVSDRSRRERSFGRPQL